MTWQIRLECDAEPNCCRTVFKSTSEASSTFDYVVCANKAIGQDEVANQLKPVVDDHTTIVIAQNGNEWTWIEYTNC